MTSSSGLHDDSIAAALGGSVGVFKPFATSGYFTSDAGDADWGAVSKDHPDPSIDVAGPKVEHPPELRFSDHGIQFRSVNGALVELSGVW